VYTYAASRVSRYVALRGLRTGSDRDIARVADAMYKLITVQGINAQRTHMCVKRVDQTAVPRFYCYSQGSTLISIEVQLSYRLNTN
jgi:hypothetical protein